MNILVLEDDPDIRELICQSLSLAEYNTHGCADIGMAKRALDDFEPDCIIVDWMLADSSGLEFIRWLRRQQAYRNTPTLMLTAKSQEPDKIMGLESGADDYMTKPMSLRELHARVKALLRRPSTYVEAGDLLQIGSLELNRKTREVQIDQQPVDHLARGSGLMGYQRRAEHLAGKRDDLVDRFRQPDAALFAGPGFTEFSLAAPAGMNLRLHHPNRAAEFLGRRPCLAG